MKNPLKKRYFRELKSDFGKYAVIFLFLVLLISMVSGFLVADNNFHIAYEEGFQKYNIEDGHITFNAVPAEEFLERIEGRGNLSFTEMNYLNEKIINNERRIRIYEVRTKVNLECVMKGSLPTGDDEIAIDRMFAENNSLNIGDELTVQGRKLKITGYVALPDYSCLYEKNSDMMFDAINFGVGVMTNNGINRLNSPNIHYNYAWSYNTSPRDEAEENKNSEELIEIIREETEAYNKNVILERMTGQSDKELIIVEDYLPGYLNNAITFTGEDLGKDAVIFLIFNYIVVAIIAFVFAVTTSNTISREAGVIGTLRASGYTRGELVKHYLAMPVIVTLLASIIGNVLGYTLLKDYYVKMYYESYSLATYEDRLNVSAFISTTLVPVLLMLIINLFLLAKKLKLSPLQFLRRELSKNRKKNVMKLSDRLPFMHRFRIRILLQNLPAYITLFIGIFFGAVVIVFGTMFMPLIKDYSKLVSESKLANYQYVVRNCAETDNEDAEKYSIKGLDFAKPGYVTDEVSVYGVFDNSRYITEDIPKGEVYISNGFAEKYGVKEGDEIELSEHFEDKTYTFRVYKIKKYDAAFAVFMRQEDFVEKFDKEESFFSGYFSNSIITDLEDNSIVTIVTEDDLIKAANQLDKSMGAFMGVFTAFGVIMFLMLMFIMTKQIIERNTVSISMTKILGFRKCEIGNLYLVITSIVVMCSLFLCIPITDMTLRWLFKSVMYKYISGYIPYIVSPSCYVVMVILGIASYAVVSMIMMIKIGRIPKSEALKNVE